MSKRRDKRRRGERDAQIPFFGDGHQPMHMTRGERDANKVKVTVGGKQTSQSFLRWVLPE